MRIRTDKAANYKAIFFNGKTVRQRLNNAFPITTPSYAEIEDVAINSKCFAACSYCYTSATKNGSNFENIIDKAKEVWGEVEENNRPFQIAIGGAGESTIHPDWVEFVKAVRELNILPNYTTNGMHLSNDILDATERYCGGVAVSYHPHIPLVFESAISKLKNIQTKLNTHIIIGNQESLNDLKRIYNSFREIVEYFVILPYQAVGRAENIDVEDTWSETFAWINSLNASEQKKFAFGALFYNWLNKNNVNLNIDVYEPEIYSGYRMFDDSYKILRKSSYNLNPKK